MNNRRHPLFARLPLWSVALIVGALFLTAVVASLLVYTTVRAGGLFRPSAPGTGVTATPAGPPVIELSLVEGGPGSLVLVTGANWAPQDTVVLSLDDPADGRAPEVNADGLLAVGRTDHEGRLSESFVYPSDSRWANLTRVFVVARSQTAGQVAFAPFRLVQATATPQLTPTETPRVVFATAVPTQGPPACTDRAGFIADVTVPDNSNISAGSGFEKIWRVRNTGTCTWRPHYALVFTGGSGMSGPSSVQLGVSVFPGDSVDLKVSLKAPSASGTYRGNWMLENSSGERFGVGGNAALPLWVQIVVGPVGSTVDGMWKGEYFNNRTLAGSPRALRQDVVIDFNWGRGQPRAEIPSDNFSVRWTGRATFDAATYRFHVLADDGVRLWIDDVLVLDQWRDQSASEFSVDVALSKGKHDIRLEYYERTHDARVRLRWERQPNNSFADWKGEYFANRDLTGAPVLVRNDRVVDFNWRDKAPAAGLPADNFSARWTRRIHFNAGEHRFIVRADDGVRVFVDGQRILNEWRDNDGKQEYIVTLALSGQKTVVVEFYEHRGSALIAFDIEQVLPTATPTITPTATETVAPSETPVATATPSPTPTGEPSPTATAAPTIDPDAGMTQVLNLGAAVCSAEWQSGDGVALPCPGTTRTEHGRVRLLQETTMEDGILYQGPALQVESGAAEAATVTGRYPARQFQAGERFRARIGCHEGVTSCAYVYRLLYLDQEGIVHTLGAWVESGDGSTQIVDLDLGALSGLSVSLLLQIEAQQSNLTNAALWLRPRIVGSSSPDPILSLSVSGVLRALVPAQAAPR